MATAEFRIEVDMSACDALIAEFRAHVDRMGKEEVTRRLGGEIDVGRYFTLEWPEKDVARGVPTEDFREALHILAADLTDG